MKLLTVCAVLMCFACLADEKTQEEVERIVRTTENDDIRVFFLPPSWLVPPLTNRTYSVKDFKLLTQGEKTELALPAAADGTRETYLFENGRVTGVRLHGGGTDETLMFNESAIFKLVPESVRPAFLLQAATNSIAHELLGFVAGADADREITVYVKQIDGQNALDVAFPSGVYWRFLLGRLLEVLPKDSGMLIKRFNGPPRTLVSTSIFCLHRTNYKIAASPDKRRGKIAFIGDKKLDIIFDYDRKGRDGWSVLVRDYEAHTEKMFDFSGNFIKSRKLDLENPMLNSRGDPFKD